MNTKLKQAGITTLGIVLVVILLLVLLGAVPVWPHVSYWGGGYGVPSIVGLILIVVVVLALMGRL